ncbi:sulfotransferase [Sphingomonas alpina]|uniref:Aspartyl beta-hydroxylase n=1 Tax=Sphingomonas alpina TaxID=653931 RepID=A0A7H0LLS7_9SPHN|nr:sulfotransferase [Sphingomonas alpina]QNQ10630.1 aspartyl beta-hydroxylase [Sphingomonas alpina]
MTASTDIRDVAALLDRFRDHAMNDAALLQRLASIYDDSVFATAVAEVAAAQGIALSAVDVRNMMKPDPAGMSRFDETPPRGLAWPDTQWLPSAMVAAGPEMVVDWVHFAGRRLTDPFFMDSLIRARPLPINRLMRYRTPLSNFAQGAPAKGLPTPDGFVFHLSRCGSTLVAQMLAAMDDTIVASEPSPLDDVIQWARIRADVPIEIRLDVLRAMVGALGRDRTGGTRHYVVKLDCWHTLELPLLRLAFPDTPWVFLYRDPVEILVSHMRMRGIQTVAGASINTFGIVDGQNMPVEEYTARVLRSIAEAAIEHQPLGGGLLINYDALPDAVEAQILSHFGIDPDDDARAALRRAGAKDAKAPMHAFSRDTERKQQTATPAVRAAAVEHLADSYRRLEDLRLAQGATSGSR